MSAFRTITSDNVTVSSTLSFPNRVGTSNLPTGAANQVLITNGSGLPVYGNVPQGAIGNGSTEQSMWWVGGVSSWQSRSFRQNIAFAKFTSQNWNSGATTALTYTGTTLSTNSYGPATYTGISNSVPGTSFLINTSAYYRINMFCCLTNSGAGTSVVRFNVLVGGIPTGPGPIIQLGAGEVGTISCTFPLLITATSVVSFQATRISGTDTLTSDALNNSISITLQSTLS